MSKKTEILVAGVLSAALFTGFTSYSYYADKAAAKAAAKQSAPVVAAAAPAQPDKSTMRSKATPPADAMMDPQAHAGEEPQIPVEGDEPPAQRRPAAKPMRQTRER